MQHGLGGQTKQIYAVGFLANYQHGKRFRDYTAAGLLEIAGEVLDRTAEGIGVTRKFSPTLAAGLLQLIKKFYSALYPVEIEMAFDLALAGEIEAPTEHFNSFDKKLFSKTMSAYYKYRNDAAGMVKNWMARNETVKALPSGENRKREAGLIVWVCETYAKFRKGFAEGAEIPTFLTVIYDILDRYKLISITAERKRELYADAKTKAHQYNTAKNAVEAKTVRDVLHSMKMGTEGDEAQWKAIAKKLALVEQFMQWDAVDFDLKAAMEERMEEQLNRGKNDTR